MWKKYGRVRLTTDDSIMGQVRIACWITNATNTHSECVILIPFKRQQWLRELASLLLYRYIDWIVRKFPLYPCGAEMWLEGIKQACSINLCSWLVFDSSNMIRLKRLQIYTHNMSYLLLFHSNNGYANAPHSYVIRTLFVFFDVQVTVHRDKLTFKWPYIVINWRSGDRTLW